MTIGGVVAKDTQHTFAKMGPSKKDMKEGVIITIQKRIVVHVAKRVRE